MLKFVFEPTFDELRVDIAARLQNFLRGKGPSQKIFGLTGPSISNKMKRFAQKAGLDSFHAHVTRHKYAVDLLESGVDLRTVQQLLGHSDLGTTAVYLAVTDKRLRDAMGKLKDHRDRKKHIRQPKSDEVHLYTKTGMIVMKRPRPTTAVEHGSSQGNRSPSFYGAIRH